MDMNKREIHNELTEIVGKGLYFMHLPMESPYKAYSDNAYIDRARSDPFFRAQVNAMTAALFEFVEKKIEESEAGSRDAISMG